MNHPEVGRITLPRAEVIPFPYWLFTFGHMDGQSIWTDDPCEMPVIAPGRMEVEAALKWARSKVPDSWLLISARYVA